MAPGLGLAHPVPITPVDDQVACRRVANGLDGVEEPEQSGRVQPDSALGDGPSPRSACFDRRRGARYVDSRCLRLG